MTSNEDFDRIKHYKSLLPMTVIMKESLKGYPAPDCSAKLARIVDLYEMDHQPIAFSAAKDSLTRSY